MMSAPLRRKTQDMPSEWLNYLNVLPLSQKHVRMQALPTLLKLLHTGVTIKLQQRCSEKIKKSDQAFY